MGMVVSFPASNFVFWSCAVSKNTEKQPKGCFFLVRQAWRVARKRNQLGCGGHAGDWEVKVLYTPGKGKC